MIKTTALLKKYNIKDPIRYDDVVSMGTFQYYFMVKPYKTPHKGEAKAFISILKEHCASDYMYDQWGTGRYFFKAGGATIECWVAVEKGEIEIETFLSYNKETVHKDLYKIIKVDYLLYCLLKRHGLQA